MRKFVYKTEMECPVDALYAWHLRPWALERLTPAWLDVQVKQAAQKLEKGLKIDLTVRKFGIPVDCRFSVTDLETDKFFADQQVKGPFAFWRHEHKFEAISCERSLMNDDIRYSLPLGSISECFLAAYMEKDLQRLFRYRHEVLKHDMAAYVRNLQHARKKVLVLGERSRLFYPLVQYLSTQGHTVLAPDLDDQESDVEKLAQGFPTDAADAYIHLGDSGSQSRAYNLSLLERFGKSGDLSVYLEVHDAYKGDNSNEHWQFRCDLLSERSPICVYARTGAVVSPAFGVLQTNPNWKDETQPWIAVDDVVSAIEYCMLDETISGQIHMSANQKKPPTKDFTTMLETQYPFRYSALKAARKHVLGL